jgi:tetratricopeptide (TPR) repeat protein
MKKGLLIFAITLVNLLSAFGQDSYLDKGNSLLSKGDFGGAEKAFRKGIKADPDNDILKCQLGLTLIKKKEYGEAELVLDKVLKADSMHIGANWYSGIGCYQNAKDRKAIMHFERVMPLLDKNMGQYFGANWYIGKSYSNLLKLEGLTYTETDRMFDCFEEYLRLQPNAEDSNQIREYVDRKKKRRPGSNVKLWMDL